LIRDKQNEKNGRMEDIRQEQDVKKNEKTDFGGGRT